MAGCFAGIGDGTYKHFNIEFIKDSGFRCAPVLLCNNFNDLREIVQEIANNNQDAIMAMETFSRRVAKYIVAYANELEGKIDGIIFTAGIGENNAKVLNLIFDKLHLFKLSINQNALSEQYSDYKLISNSESAYAIYQVRTDEELMIEQDVKTLLKL